jgi:DNA-directed RNA polymerase subunit M/transcription elongation factor TFIIS
MINNMAGGMLGLALLMQPEVLRWYLEAEELTTETPPIVRGVSWLSEADDEHRGAPPELGEWTCPRCGSHRCIQTNPGDLRGPTFCCCICGYMFGNASA